MDSDDEPELPGGDNFTDVTAILEAASIGMWTVSLLLSLRLNMEL